MISAVTLIAFTGASPGLALTPEEQQREQFSRAWKAASKGDQQTFETLGAALTNYRLYPYIRYEQLRQQLAKAASGEMTGFLEGHADWAFTAGLRKAWLRDLGQKGNWQVLLDHARRDDETEIRCHRANAQIQLDRAADLLAEAQALWTAAKSQPDACDPVFAWLKKKDGITTTLAWQRIRLAMAAGNPRLTLYLARFVPTGEQVWLERWQTLTRNGYRGLEKTRTWPDQPLTQMISQESLKRLARRDADRAWQAFKALDGHFSWSPEERGALLHAIALNSAVSLSAATNERMRAVPVEYSDSQLLQWWTRSALASGDWETALSTIEKMPAESADDSRWRYWKARALAESGETAAATVLLETLSLEANFHGFLAADRLQRPYTICPLEPAVTPAEIGAIRAQPDFQRALELRRAGIDNWATAEWTLAAARLETGRLRAAAGLAFTENWFDRAIFALGNSGDQRYYEWRFPTIHQQTVTQQAASEDLDPAWIYGIMRSESALAEQARSSAGALGLMQVTPGTARQLAKKHGLSYQGRETLLEPEKNIRFGTVFLRDLLERFDQDPVLVMGAYNAGPSAVDRWLDERPRTEPAVWIESLPYYETRDYIPRVLAFSTLYEWRLRDRVTRVSSRMPGQDSGKIPAQQTTEVVCRASS